MRVDVRAEAQENVERAEPQLLRIPALRVQQGPERTLYTFAIDGKLLPQVAAVSRVRRDEEHHVAGYQRPEVLSHIAEIRRYLESTSPMIPNAIVIAFDQRVQFTPHPSVENGVPYVASGELTIPVMERGAESDLPGWIVDGQQRTAAIRDAQVERFPICVTAFITADLQEQREQFILVNSTKPLPKGLIYELLPCTESRLPSMLQKRRFPAHLLDRLNNEERSPFYRIIQTPTNPGGLIKDNSVLKMLENSLTDGALSRYRDSVTGRGDEEKMLAIVCSFWKAVSEVFSDAWGITPRRSRLMHGAGVVALGYIMDAISDRFRGQEATVELFEADLRPLKDVCRWTGGFWHFGGGDQRKWNEVQNTPKDVNRLANHLLVEYKRLVWSTQHEGTRSSTTLRA